MRIYAVFLAASLSTLFPQEPPSFHTDVTLVTVPCAVTDDHGRNLRTADFRVYSDGALQKIQSVWTESDLPLVLGIIKDVSESQRDQTAEHETAVAHFLERMIGPQDRGFVVEVNDQVILKSEVTRGPYGLRHTVLPQRGEPLGGQCGTRASERGRRLAICGGTALWNSVYSAAQIKLSRPNGSKAILILSDGNDTGSTHNLSMAIEQAQRNNVVVYAIKYPDASGLFDSSNGLKRLTIETGGMIFDPRGADYSAILSQIETDLRSHYILAFRPESDSIKSERHSLRIEVPAGLSVRSRKTYFDQLPPGH